VAMRASSTTTRRATRRATRPSRSARKRFSKTCTPPPKEKQISKHEPKHETNKPAGITPELAAELDKALQKMESVAQATALLVDAARLEEGLPTEVQVLRSVTALEDALAMLVEESQEAEDT
jgi:hypothetical protein